MIIPILESILEVDDSFYDIIHSLVEIQNRQNRHNIVVSTLYNFISKDINTSQNYISTGQKNDEVNSINDTKVSEIKEKGLDPFKSKGNVLKIGRLSRQLLELNDVKFNDKDIEEFVNLYKNAWDSLKNPFSNISIVDGESIRDWYNGNLYLKGGGTLGNSCMRYTNCQEYFDIYCKNPEVCKMIIWETEDGFLRSRALVWKTTSGYFMDRIYSRHDRDAEVMIEFAKSKYDNISIFRDRIPNLNVILGDYNYEKFPYADSLQYFYLEKNILSSYLQNGKHGTEDLGVCFRLVDTGGSFVLMGYVFSKRQNKYIKDDIAVFVDAINDYMDPNECVKSLGGWIPKDECIFSELYNTNLFEPDVIDTEWGLAPYWDMVEVISENGISKVPRKKMGEIFTAVGRYYYMNNMIEKSLTGLIVKDKSNIEVFPIKNDDHLKSSGSHRIEPYGLIVTFNKDQFGGLVIGIGNGIDGIIYSSKCEIDLYQLEIDEDNSSINIAEELYDEAFSKINNYDNCIKLLNSIGSKNAEDALNRISSKHKIRIRQSPSYRDSYFGIHPDKSKLYLFNELFQSKLLDFDFSLFSRHEVVHLTDWFTYYGFNGKDIENESLSQYLNQEDNKKILLEYKYYICVYDSTHRSLQIMNNKYGNFPRYMYLDNIIKDNSLYEVIEILYRKCSFNYYTFEDEDIMEYVNWSSCKKYLEEYPTESFEDWYLNYYKK